jgi:hypothetical protein
MKTFAKFTTLFVLILFVFGTATFVEAAPSTENAKTIALRLRGTDHIQAGAAITAELNSTFNGLAQLTVENAKGQRFAETEMALVEGRNLVKFKVSEIPSGIYFIKVKSEGKSETVTFVVH